MQNDVITGGFASSYVGMLGKQGKVILEGPCKALLRLEFRRG